MAFSAQGHEKLSFILSTMASAIGIWAIQQRSMTIENDTTPLDFNSLLQQVNTALNVLICSDRLVTPQVDHRDSSSLLSPLYCPYSAENSDESTSERSKSSKRHYGDRDDQQEDDYNNDDDGLECLKIVPRSNERYVSSEYDNEFVITATTSSKRSKTSESFSSSSKSSTSSSPALLVNKENKSDRKRSDSRKVSIVVTDDNENDDGDDRKSESAKNEPKLSSREREALKKTGKEYDMKCLFVDNLPEFVTRSELDPLFPKNNQIFIQHNNRLKYSFAFVYFETEKDAEKAKINVMGKKWKGKLMKVSYSFVWDSSKSSNSGVGDNNNKSSNQQKAYKRIDNVKIGNLKGKRKVTKPKNF